MKVIIVGASGMVGKSVLLECLEDADTAAVLAIGRSSVDLTLVLERSLSGGSARKRPRSPAPAHVLETKDFNELGRHGGSGSPG